MRASAVLACARQIIYIYVRSLKMAPFDSHAASIYCVVFKTALIVWKCVHDVAPAYLSDLCVPATFTLLVPRARAATRPRSSALNGPATWNRLPPALRSPDLSESAGTEDAPVNLDRPAPLRRLHASGAGKTYLLKILILLTIGLPL